MTAKVILSSGLVALVDESAFEQVVAAGPWHATPPRGGRVYAQRSVRRGDGRRTTQKLHSFLTGWAQVDHRNGDGLDNQRSNLREATRTQNNANSRRRTDNTSGFKGVTLDARIGRWNARIHVNGRRRSLGYFATAEQAAVAYDSAAREIFGEFARPNYPKEKAS